MKKLSDNIIVNMFGVVVFLLFPLLHFFTSHHAQEYTSFFYYRPIFSASIVLIYYYINQYILIPNYYFNQRIHSYIVFVFVSFSLIECVEFFSFHYQKLPLAPQKNFNSNVAILQSPEHRHRGDSIPFHVFDRDFILFLLATIFPIAFQINHRWKKAEQERINSQLSFLKAQINPHFLFNTLNSVYSLSILEKADRTSDSLVKLSGMMRYILTESSGDKVLLEQEIKYIRDFFDLQRLRADRLIEMKLSVEGECGERKITPMLLIPFVENAFKYGVNPEVQGKINIQLTITHSDLRLYVFNMKASTGIHFVEKTGLGISNTKNRLQHLYPGQHQLKIIETENDFAVELKISFA